MDIIRQLGSSEGIPAEAIRAATADRATVTPLLVDALEKFKVNVEMRARRASSMMKPWEVRGSNKEERIPKPL